MVFALTNFVIFEGIALMLTYDMSGLIRSSSSRFQARNR